jgi:HEAT repeat protein
MMMFRRRFILLGFAMAAVLVGGLALSHQGVVLAAAHSDLIHQSYLAPGCGNDREVERAAGDVLDHVAETSPDTLIALLDHPDRRVRAACALTLAWYRVPSAARPIAAVVHDPDPDVRGCALGALARYDAPWSVPLLRDGLTDPDETLRRCVIVSLFEAHHPEVTTLLCSAASDKDPWLRRMAIDGLARTQPPGAITVIIRALKDRDPIVANAAADALLPFSGDARVRAALARYRSPGALARGTGSGP